jgi:hypothetical protein
MIFFCFLKKLQLLFHFLKKLKLLCDFVLHVLFLQDFVFKTRFRNKELQSWVFSFPNSQNFDTQKWKTKTKHKGSLINDPVRISLFSVCHSQSHRPAQQQLLLQQSICKSAGPPRVGLKNRDFTTQFPPHHVQYPLLRSCSWSSALGFGSKRWIHIPQWVQLASSLLAPFGSYLAASIHSCRYKCWFQLPRICRGCVDLEEDHNWCT